MKTILSLICFLIFTTLLNAQRAGTLDSSFGLDGKVVTDFDTGTDATIYKGLVQPDNKIIAVGDWSSVPLGQNGFLVFRYLPDGSIDSSFGDSGKTVIHPSFEDDLTASSACLQQDGKILVAGVGTAGWPQTIASGIIVRLNTNGSLDSSFGVDGSIQTTLGNSTTYNAIAVQPDGKIVGVGTSTNRFVNRFLQNGSPDLSFGTKGFVFYSSYDVFYSCLIQPDGKIVIGGGYFGTTPEKFCLKRFQSNGAVDSSFGSAGTTVTQIGSYDSYITNLALQSDGKIVALGQPNNGYSTATARYNVDGSIDNTFADDGISQDYFPGTFGIAYGLLIQSDNKILLGGNAVENGKGNYGIERLTQDGLRDSSFGVDGLVTTDFVDYAGSVILSLGFQSSGKIVAIGQSSNTNDYNVSLARYNNNNDESKKQKIISKIKHYIQNHNNLESSSTADAKAATLNISIAPNPVNSILTINGLSVSTKYAVRITNESGNTVANKQVSNISSYRINVQGLSAGVYYVNIISNNNQSTTLKFIKQ